MKRGKQQQQVENEMGKGGISSSSSNDIEAPPLPPPDDNLRFILPYPCSYSSSVSSPTPLRNNKTPSSSSSYISKNGIRRCSAINNIPHKVHSFSSSTNPTTTTTTTPPPNPPSGRASTSTSKDDHSDPKSHTNKSAGSSNRTPPIKVSVSPEIMSSVAAAAMPTPTTLTTPCCYGAPHVISGVTVTDKRRRRPLGLLVVGQPPKPFVPFHVTTDYDYDDPQGISLGKDIKDAASGESPSPPLQASMHWFRSPSREVLVVDEDRGGPTAEHHHDDGSHFSHSSPASSPSSHSTHTTLTCHLCAYSGSSHTIVNATTSGGITTPGWKHTSNRALPLLDKDTTFPHLDGCSSPVSIDSVGSANVMQTPQSDTTSDYKFATTCVSDNDTRAKLIFEAKLDEVGEHLHGASLSPKTHVSLWKPDGSSFQIDLSTAPPDPVNNLFMLQKILDPHASWSTKCSVEIAHQSLTRISWRDRLESAIFDMDKLCCRCFSDEEDEFKGLNICSKSQFSPQFSGALDQILADDVGSCEAIDGECCIMCRNHDKLPPQAHHCCAESVSTDGGGLICSDDSDWTSCYKNRLFQG